jgi:hypothetical protein
MNIGMDRAIKAGIQVLIILAAALSFPPSMAESQNICPSPLTGGRHNSGGYIFEYQSWSWIDPDEHGARSYCHCVRNNTPARPLFVNWTEVGLSTIIPPDQVAYAYFSSSAGGPTQRTVPLWYGARPDRIDAQTVFNTQAAQMADAAQPEAPAVDAPSASGQRVSSADTALETKVAAFLPDLERIANAASKDSTHLTREEIVQSIEKNAALLVGFEMQFSSTPQIESQSGAPIAVRNACDYQFGKISLNKQSLDFAMRIKDAQLHQMIFRTSEVMPLRNWPGKPQRFEGSAALQTPQASTLTLSTTTLEIIAIGSDVVLASVDIRYYSATPNHADEPQSTSAALSR